MNVQADRCQALANKENYSMTPCQAYNCDNQARCKAEQVACHAFYFYVEVNRLYHPKTKFRYTQKYNVQTSIVPEMEPSKKVMKMIFRG